MNCRISTAPDFDKGIKALAKRYPSMRNDYQSFLKQIEENPTLGTALGHNLRKVRFAIESKGKGKSGGARVITHTVLLASDGANVTLLAIYDKSDRANITDKELRVLIQKNGLL